jgi:hypothetical protein
MKCLDCRKITLQNDVCQVSDLNCAAMFDVQCCGVVLIFKAFNSGQTHVMFDCCGTSRDLVISTSILV